MKLHAFALGLLALGAVSCSGEQQASTSEKDTVTLVTTTVVHTSPVNEQIVLSGSIEGATTVKLSFMVAGKVNAAPFKQGQLISKGQLVASLEPTDYSLANQLADVKQQAAADEYIRLKLLHEKGSLAESDFVKAGFALQQARLEQKVQAKSLSDTKLYAPISGVLLEKQTEIGEVVAAGTSLFSLADIRKVTVSVSVPESELHKLRIGLPGSILIDALSKTFTGKITELGSIADPSSRTFLVKLQIDNPGLLIRPGMVAQATITPSGTRQAMFLPMESVLQGVDGQSYVYVADRPSGKAFKRKVSIGAITGNNIEILAGLSLGEAVITAGQEKLSDGSVITITK